jgi:tRNA A37 threonylcarbamoyladenosine dehydratase
MKERNSRTEMLIGSEAVEKIGRAKVAVFGIGGVGGYAVEALCRAGVGELLLVDSDKVCESNLNRQIIATEKTLGEYKTLAAKERVREINSNIKVDTREVFFSPENENDFDLSTFDYIIDAIDSLPSKLALIAKAKREGVRIISAMGAGNKLDPTRFEVSDISKTTVCPLARAVRLGLRRMGINHLKVVYSKETPVRVFREGEEKAPASISFVPSSMGLIIGGEVIKDIAFEGRGSNDEN